MKELLPGKEQPGKEESDGEGAREGEKDGCRWQVCEKEDGEEMRFPLIFHGSYTLWIFISAGREACEACFI